MGYWFVFHGVYTLEINTQRVATAVSLVVRFSKNLFQSMGSPSFFFCFSVFTGEGWNLILDPAFTFGVNTNKPKCRDLLTCPPGCSTYNLRLRWSLSKPKE